MSDNTNNNNFEIQDTDHDIEKKYHPKFLAKGGEHIVYEIPTHPGVIVKVETKTLKKIIDWNSENGKLMDNMTEELKLGTKEYLNKARERYLQLKKYFGEDHVLNQKQFLIKVPITENILNKLYDDKPPAHGKEAWGILMVQRRVKELADPNHLTIVAGYAENNEQLKSAVYNKVTEHLVFGKDPENKLDKNDFLAVQSKSALEKLVTNGESDKELKQLLEDFIKKSIKYSKDTGEILDLTGHDNVVFFQVDGQWTFKIIDGLYPDTRNMVDGSKTALLQLHEGKEIDPGQKNMLLNTFNYVRTINGLAERIGLQERINIVPEGIKLTSIDFLKILKES